MHKNLLKSLWNAHIRCDVMICQVMLGQLSAKSESACYSRVQTQNALTKTFKEWAYLFIFSYWEILCIALSRKIKCTVCNAIISQVQSFLRSCNVELKTNEGQCIVESNARILIAIMHWLWALCKHFSTAVVPLYSLKMWCETFLITCIHTVFFF